MVEKALENEIQERVRNLSNQNPNGFGSLPLSSNTKRTYNEMNTYYNYSFPTAVNQFNGINQRTVWQQF